MDRCYAPITRKTETKMNKDIEDKSFTIANKTFTGQNLSGDCFVGITIKNTDFSNCKLSNVEFSNSVLDSCIFNGASLNGAIFGDSELYNCKFNGASLKKINFEESKIRKCEFNGSYINLSNFRNSEIVDTTFRGSLLKLSNFSFSELKLVHFFGSNLKSSNFSSSKIYSSAFIQCDLECADFFNSKLRQMSTNGSSFNRIKILSTTLDWNCRELIYSILMDKIKFGHYIINQDRLNLIEIVSVGFSVDTCWDRIIDTISYRYKDKKNSLKLLAEIIKPLVMEGDNCPTWLYELISDPLKDK